MFESATTTETWNIGDRSAEYLFHAVDSAKDFSVTWLPPRHCCYIHPLAKPHSVSEPSSYIIGGPDLFVDVGSMVNISCVVVNTDKPPDTVKWLHGDEEISFRGPRNGVSVE